MYTFISDKSSTVASSSKVLVVSLICNSLQLSSKQNSSSISSFQSSLYWFFRHYSNKNHVTGPDYVCMYSMYKN